MDTLETLKTELMSYGNGPRLEDMPRARLEDKGLDGPTAAHRIEELHTPFNLAFITCTTGSTAFENIVGVTHEELPDREVAAKRALASAGIAPGDRLVITYPPLVSVFTKRALDEYGAKFSFIMRPSRDALLVALCTESPHAVIGESSFLRAAFEDARRLGLSKSIPPDLIVVAAGSPMDTGLAEICEGLPGKAVVHDLYGCQEFGWLVCDGTPLRDDTALYDTGRRDGRRELIIGGLATGDSFIIGRGRDGEEIIHTATRMRSESELETTLEETTVSSRETAARAARTVLRIKGRIVRLSDTLVCGAERTVLSLTSPGAKERLYLVGPASTAMFDALLAAQLNYQGRERSDPVWNKLR